MATWTFHGSKVVLEKQTGKEIRRFKTLNRLKSSFWGFAVRKQHRCQNKVDRKALAWKMVRQSLFSLPRSPSKTGPGVRRPNVISLIQFANLINYLATDGRQRPVRKSNSTFLLVILKKALMDKIVFFFILTNLKWNRINLLQAESNHFSPIIHAHTHRVRIHQQT